jgi:hypothetical protein
LLVLLALLLLGAAGAAFFVAGLIEWLACEVESSEACERHGLAQLQLAVAAAAVAPSLAVAVSLVARKRRTGFLALVIAVVLYGTWAILADAAVHGWDDLKLIPF